MDYMSSALVVPRTFWLVVPRTFWHVVPWTPSLSWPVRRGMSVHVGHAMLDRHRGGGSRFAQIRWPTATSSSSLPLAACLGLCGQEGGLSLSVPLFELQRQLQLDICI